MHSGCPVTELFPVMKNWISWFFIWEYKIGKHILRKKNEENEYLEPYCQLLRLGFSLAHHFENFMDEQVDLTS